MAQRIAGGLWVLWSGLRKANRHGIGRIPGEIEEYAQRTPIGWYGRFLRRAVLPRGPVFARLVVAGEIGVGASLALGLLTPLAAMAGIFMHLNYLLAAGFPRNHPEQAQNGALILMDAAALATGSGRAFGLDGLLCRRAARHGPGEPAGAAPARARA
ncbi:MAG: DoxX family membrane protein [Armatimonadetes bacterium]|nr:DoxX family membrane protein [Armatimonadota bacterium]